MRLTPGIRAATAIAGGPLLSPRDPPVLSVAVPVAGDKSLCPDAQGREQGGDDQVATGFGVEGPLRARQLDLIPADFYAEFIQLLFSCKF